MPIDAALPVICVTPVKNEAWILQRFLDSAARWADAVIVADQGSSDGSREIVQSHPKARLVVNESSHYDEGARQRLLLREARRIEGPKLIVALDADEALSADVACSPEWRRLKRSAPGTIGLFPWVNLLAGGTKAWIPGKPIPFALVDSGVEHTGERIHSTRVPVSADADLIVFTDVVVLHFQHLAVERMESKHRWYQCWELLNGGKRPVQIFRQYHRRLSFPASEVQEVDPGWIADLDPAFLAGAGQTAGPMWWDLEVLGWLQEHGPERFRRLDIWDVNWADRASAAGRSLPQECSRDPRNTWERAVHRWLARSQDRADSPSIRLMQQALRPLGW